jgi:hypothetical protein
VVNAKIFLHNMPRIGMVEDQLNAYYQRVQVNYFFDEAAENPEKYLVDMLKMPKG